MARPIKQFDNGIILNQFANGMTITQLAKMYHTSFYNIRPIVEECCVTKRVADCTRLYGNIYEDYCNGMVSYKMLSTKHNVSLQVVRKAMRLNGVWQRNSFKPDMERRERIEGLLAKGIRQIDIATQEGVSRQLVSAIAKKLKKETK